MPKTKLVVLDTHVFLAAVSGSEGKHESAVRVYRQIVDACYRFAINDDITDEYQLKAQRFGITGQFVQDILRNLKSLGKLQRTGKQARKQPVTVGPEQDRPFIECAIGADADYVVTRDPDFQDFEDIAGEHHFEILDPERYLRKEGQGLTLRLCSVNAQLSAVSPQQTQRLAAGG